MVTTPRSRNRSRDRRARVSNSVLQPTVEHLSALDRLHLELMVKNRLEQIPETDRHLPGFRRTIERISTGEETSPVRVATALNNALVNRLLEQKIVPYGLNWGKSSIDDLAERQGG